MTVGRAQPKELNQDLDVEKVNSKISMWQSQLEGLSALLKKI
ncbi:hypothetical protein [Prevotella denticola]|nr:hypothetical protein [Prevotella denticola]